MSSRISESELVLNPDGSVYHLNLLPHELADTIILVGDPDRVTDVSQHFDSIEVKKQKREFVSHTGFIGRKRLSVISTGIGTDNIDIVLNELDALVNLDPLTRRVKPNLKTLFFIRLGTAGALQESIPLESIVVSRWGLGLDSLLHFYESPNPLENQPLLQAIKNHLFSFKIEPYLTQGSDIWINKFSAGCYSGITATCSGFYGPQGRILRAPLRHSELFTALHTFNYAENKIVNMEMETSAIYGLAQLLGHQACSLSTIVANRITGKFTLNAYQAIQNMVKFALEKICEK